jgi:hypothetical protein
MEMNRKPIIPHKLGRFFLAKITKVKLCLLPHFYTDEEKKRCLV